MKTLFGNALPIPVSLFRIDKWQLLLVIVFTVFIVYRNFLLMVDGMGEQDTVRFMNNAIIWHNSGNIEYGSSQASTSPGYLALIKYFIDSGISYGKVIHIINSMNAVFGAALIFLSFFFFRLFFSFITAFACLVMLSFVPSIFISSIYGFPTLLAYTAFCVSILLFVQSSIILSRLSLPLLFAAAIALSIGTILKADIILLAGCYFGVLLAFDRLSYRRLTAALCIIVAAALAPIIFKFLIFPNATPATTNFVPSAQKWSEHFPLSSSYFFSSSNIALMLKSVGPIFAALGIFGVISSALKSDTRRITWMVILFALPVIIFWGPRPGNSARHMLGIAIPTIMMVGVLFQSLKYWHFSRSTILASTAIVIIINYFSTSVSSSTVAPSSRLLESSRMLREKVVEHMTRGDSIAKTAEGKIYLIEDYSVLYSVYNILKHSRSINLLPKDKTHSYMLDITLQSGRGITLGWTSAASLEHAGVLAKEMRRKGFVIWSSRYPGI